MEIPLSKNELKETIKKLNSIDLENSKYEDIFNIVVKMKLGRAFSGVILNNPNISLFRGIVYVDKPTHVKQLSYPPAKLITSFQRANPPNKPMFYCGEEPRIPFYELKLRQGDRVYLSKWSVRNPFAAISVEYSDKDNELDNIVKTFFQTKFSQRIHETFSSDYKITSAIAEILSTGTVTAKNYEVGAIIYPSVSMVARSDNLAIRPKIVDSCLKLDYVKEYLVKEIKNSNINIDEKDFTNDFSNKTINWKGRPGIDAKLKNQGDSIHAISSTFGWVIKDKHGNIIDPI